MHTLFPFDKARPGQDRFMDIFRDCLEQGKNIIAHAPTGIGKTACSLAPAVDYAIKNGKTVVFLTPRHTQHKIVIDTLRSIKEKNPEVDIHVANIVGKRWLCRFKDIGDMNSENVSEFCKKMKESDKCVYYKKMFKKSGDLSPVSLSVLDELKINIMSSEDVKELCADKGICPYEALMQHLKEANVVIADYYHMLHPGVQKIFLSKMEKDMKDIILVIDEAHNVPGRARELMSSKLTSDILDRAIKEAEKFNFRDIYDDLKFLRKEIDSFCTRHVGKEDEKTVKKDVILKIVKAVSSDVNGIINELLLAGDIVTNERKISYVKAVGAFFMDWCGPEEGFVRIAKVRRNDFGVNGFEVCYDCLDPSMLTKKLFEKLHSVLLMSGTLTPVEMFEKVLGLDGGMTESLILESPFPVENKLILIKDDVTTRYAERGDKQSYKIAGNIVKTLNNIPGNIGVFFPSYNMMGSIVEILKHGSVDKEIICESRGMTKADKKMLFDDFVKSAGKDNGAALFAVMGANFSEGVDFPGELMNAVVVIGLPLERPDIKNQALINYYDIKFQKGWEYGYIYPAMNKVMQTAGRCIRSENDRGVIVLMDKRFLWSPYRELLPRDSQLYISGNLSLELQEFFKI